MCILWWEKTVNSALTQFWDSEKKKKNLSLRLIMHTPVLILITIQMIFLWKRFYEFIVHLCGIQYTFSGQCWRNIRSKWVKNYFFKLLSMKSLKKKFKILRKSERYFLFIFLTLNIPTDIWLISNQNTSIQTRKISKK